MFNSQVNLVSSWDLYGARNGFFAYEFLHHMIGHYNSQKTCSIIHKISSLACFSIRVAPTKSTCCAVTKDLIKLKEEIIREKIKVQLLCNYDIHDAIITYGLDLGLGIVNYNGIGKILLKKNCCKNCVQKHSHVNYQISETDFQILLWGKGGQKFRGLPKIQGVPKIQTTVI